MDTINMSECISKLDVLKKDVQKVQKKGLPFIMASVIIWTMVLAVQFLDKGTHTRNLYAFMCSSMLMPLAFAFSRMIKADIFKKSQNPVSKLGFLCTMNQMLYLIIVMWAFAKSPENMVMIYAVVFGAHLLPFGWVYDSIAYKIMAVAETIGAVLIAVFFGTVPMVAFMIVMELLLCILLAVEIRKGKKEIES